MRNSGKIVQESLRVRRARERLQKRLTIQKDWVNDQSLAQMIEKIRTWILSRSHERIRVLSKSHLFDQNQNSAILSQRVRELASRLDQQEDIC